MFKHTIGDEALKVIKTFSYTEDEDSNDWRVVMAKMEKHCIGKVNEIYELYCFNKRDKLPTESVDCFVAELKTLAKTCNFCVIVLSVIALYLELKMSRLPKSYWEFEILR